MMMHFNCFVNYLLNNNDQTRYTTCHFVSHNCRKHAMPFYTELLNYKMDAASNSLIVCSCSKVSDIITCK